MRDGVPILTGPDLFLKEIAGDAAYPLDPRKPESIASALLKISGDPALRASLRSRSRQRLGFFDEKTEARKLLEAWNALSGCPQNAKALEGGAL